MSSIPSLHDPRREDRERTSLNFLSAFESNIEHRFELARCLLIVVEEFIQNLRHASMP